jgi:pyruvate-formate lyase
MSDSEAAVSVLTPSHQSLQEFADPGDGPIGRSLWQVALDVTRAYQAHADGSTCVREIACLRAQLPAILQPIGAGDMLAGRVAFAPIGFSPEPGGLGYYCQHEVIAQALADGRVPLPLRLPVSQAADYWRNRTTAFAVRSAYPPAMVQALPSDNWTGEPGIGFPLYRMAGLCLDYDKLLRLGLRGLRERINQVRHRSAADAPRELYGAMLAALDLVAECAAAWGEDARKQADSMPPGESRDRMVRIGESLEAITDAPPQTLHQAMQLLLLYAIVSGALSYGRLDVSLGDFLAADLDAHRLDEGQALELVQGLWQLIADRKTTFNGRVMVGGRGRRNERNADRFALLAIEASRTVLEIEPQLTLRFHDGMDPRLMQAGLDSIGQGRTYPMLYNDDVNVPAVAKAFAVSTSEAEQYYPFGCGEYVLEHRSVGTPSGVINLLKALELTLFDGIDPASGRRIGISTGGLERFGSFDELVAAYKRQVEHHVAALAEQEALEYRIVGQIAPFLLPSILSDDCIELGRGIFSGGVRHLGGTLEAYGNTNTADSLAAIREHVYERKTVSAPELLRALRDGFGGHERLRALLCSSPKYGNDNAAADEMARLVHEHICNVTRDQAARVGLDSYLIVVINNHANTVLGRWTGASADGRGAGESMANANNPSGGADRAGVTAMLNSLTQLDPGVHAGVVQNMKFSRSMFSEHRAKLEAILGAYWDGGGTQAMITVVSRDELEQALAHPERYGHLMVRVGGFTARFVELPRAVQMEVLSRTLY